MFLMGGKRWKLFWNKIKTRLGVFSINTTENQIKYFLFWIMFAIKFENDDIAWMLMRLKMMFSAAGSGLIESELYLV